MSIVQLVCPVSPDKSYNGRGGALRLTKYDLGKCYSLKAAALTEGWMCEDVEESDLVDEDTSVNKQWICAHMTEKHSGHLDELLVEAEAGLNFGIAYLGGTVDYQQMDERNSLSLTVYQEAVKIVKMKYIKTNSLASNPAYQNRTYVVDGLKGHATQVLRFLSQNGTHFLQRVYLGARACRSIELHCSSARERKKIQAKLKAIVLGVPIRLNIDIADRFSQGCQRNILVKCDCLGGNPEHLPSTLSAEEIAGIADESVSGLNRFLDTVTAANSEVIGAEAHPITDQHVSTLYSSVLTKPEHDLFIKHLQRAADLKKYMYDWRRNLAAAKARFDRQLEQVGLSKSDARQHQQPFQEAVDTFLRAHVGVLIETLERYVNRNVMEIIKGDEQFKGYPPAGTNPGSDPKVDLKDVTIATLGTVTLTEEQMNSLYEDFMAGSVIPVRLSAGKTALWQGPIALGTPCGLPEELRFFHVDVSYEALATQYDEWKSQWKFKVRGQDWNPSTEQPYIDEHTWIEANPEGEIDFEKLPAYFKRVVYYREQNLTDFVEYQGDWRAGHLMGDGQLLYGARGLQGKKSLTAKFEQDAASSGVLEFVDASPYQEYRGCVQLVDWVARMEGPGKVTLKDGTVEYTGHFEDDRIYIPSQEVYDALDPKLQDEKVVLKFWAERDLQRAKYPQELVSAIGAAESLLSKVKNEPLQKALHEARKRLPSTLLLLGPTGAGKTALLNLLGKYKAFRGLPLHMQFPALMAAPNISAPNIESNSGDACTSVPHLYELTLPDQRVLNIIDTPGFDSTGAIQLIKDFCQSHTDISGICYVVNGRVPNRSGIGPEALKSVVDTLPEKVRQRMCAVFTNCSRLTASFTVNDPRFFVLGNTIPAAFHLDNPNEQQHLAPEDGEKLMKSLARTLEQLVEAL